MKKLEYDQVNTSVGKLPVLKSNQLCTGLKIFTVRTILSSPEPTNLFVGYTDIEGKELGTLRLSMNNIGMIWVPFSQPTNIVFDNSELVLLDERDYFEYVTEGDSTYINKDNTLLPTGVANRHNQITFIGLDYFINFNSAEYNLKYSSIFEFKKGLLPDIRFNNCKVSLTGRF